MKKRTLGVDFGDARTGLALSDISGFLASGIGTIKSKSFKQATLYAKLQEKMMLA